MMSSSTLELDLATIALSDSLFIQATSPSALSQLSVSFKQTLEMAYTSMHQATPDRGC